MQYVRPQTEIGLFNNEEPRKSARENDNYTHLATAIVLQAIKDYVKILKKKKKYADDKEKCEILELHQMEIENFILGEWFSCLSKMNGKRLLEKIEEGMKKYAIRERFIEPQIS